MRKKKANEWSKKICLLGAGMGFVIVQECFVLMYIMINHDYGASAAWLTAGVGLAEAVIIACISGYLSLCKSDHSEGGITFEKAKANNFKEDAQPEI